MSQRDAAPQRKALSAAIFRRGQKAELFDDGAADESAELQGKLGELHSVWALERTGRDLAAAIWRPELGLAEVVLQRGKLLSHMGFTWGKKLFLFIEEAVYLADRANLLLFLSGGSQRLLSLAEAHDLMACSGVGMDAYLVFCKLLRAGYIVQRHPARWVLQRGEEPGAIWGGWGQRLPPAGGGGEAQQGQGRAAAVPAAAPPAARPASPPAKRRRVDEAQQGQQRCAAWWPAAAWPVTAGDARSCEQQQGGQQQQGQEGQEQPKGGSGAAAAAGPWWQRSLPPGFLASLPRCQVALGAKQRARADFPRMAPLQQLPLADLQLPGGAAGRCLLHYDVFASNSRFSRKQPGAPSFTVCILPPSRPPGPDVMATADAAAGGVPVRFSTVEMGDICFYGTGRLELKSILQ